MSFFSLASILIILAAVSSYVTYLNLVRTPIGIFLGDFELRASLNQKIDAC